MVYFKQGHILLYFFIVLYLHKNRVESQTIAEINSLSSTLLTGYNKNTRPINNQANVLTVNASVDLIAITDFDDVTGTLSVVFAFQLEWFDEGMVWNVTANSDIENIIVSQKHVWKPAYTLANPYGELTQLGDDDWVTISYSYTGSASWRPLKKMDATCSINTRYYPFDSQKCDIEMFVFGYTYFEVFTRPTESTIGLTYYKGHSAWRVTSTKAAASLAPGEVQFYTLTLELERMPEFMIVNFLVPLMFLAALNPLVFLLPSESGERVGFAITILLSLSVFLTILGDFIPPNSDHMSLMTYMLMILYIWSTSITVVVILNIRIYFLPDSKPVGNVARGFARLCRCKCSGRKVKPTDNKLSMEKVSVKVKPATDAIAGDDSDEISWKDVADAIDIASFVFMYLIMFVVVLVYMIILKTDG